MASIYVGAGRARSINAFAEAVGQVFIVRELLVAARIFVAGW
ncbi:hypothetical protein ACQP2U_19720 [Nocardia sp. CA-084685]